MKLEHKNIFITGSSRGIGLASPTSLLKQEPTLS